MSQNMMVSWRRSAGAMVGVALADEAERGAVDAAGEDAPAARLAPHWEQNLAFAEFACPHAGQGRGRAVPHCSQKLLASGTFALQLGHCTPGTPSRLPR
jgi:hypothetical protein